MIKNNYIFWDTETSSAEPGTTQVLSLGAIAVNPRTLEVIPNSEFYSLVKPEDESTVEKQALEKNKLKLEDLKDAPTIDVVWKNFSTYVDNYKTEKGKWGKPVPGGFNIANFDMIISRRLNERFKVELWHPFLMFDVLSDYIRFTENDANVTSVSFDSVRKRMGMSAAGAHNSLQDSKDAAALALKFVKMYRTIKPKFENAFGVT